MSELAVVNGDSFQMLEDVAKHMLKGHSEYKTARDLGMKVVEVRAIWNEYKERLDNDTFARDAARDHLNLMIKQYDNLIKDLHENLESLQSMQFDEKISAQIVSTARTIADLQAKRVDLLQKAGLLDAHDLGDELAEREKQEAYIVDILRNDLCADCHSIVAVKLQKVTGKVEATQVFDDTIDGEAEFV